MILSTLILPFLTLIIDKFCLLLYNFRIAVCKNGFIYVTEVPLASFALSCYEFLVTQILALCLFMLYFASFYYEYGQ